MPRLPFHGRPMPASQLTDEEVARRWQALTPNFFRYLGLFVCSSSLIYLFNHFAHPSQKVTDILNVAFQITCALSVYYIVLCTMALVYSRKYGKLSKSA